MRGLKALTLSAMLAATTWAGATGALAQTAKIAPPARIAEAGELLICSDFTAAPAVFVAPGSTEPQGYEAEMAREMASLLGVKATFQNVQFKGIIAALLAKKCDVIISSIGDTVPREKTLDFVNYANVGTSIVVKPGNPDGITSLEGLSGHSVSVNLGTNPQLALDHVSKALVAAGKPAIDIVTFSDSVAAASALATGKVDAYYADTPPAAHQKTQQPAVFDLVTPQIFLDMIGQVNGLTAVAMRKDETELQKAFVDVVKELYASGKIAEVYKKWNVDSILLPASFLDKCIVNCATLKVE